MAEMLGKILDAVMLAVIALAAVVAIDVSKDVIPPVPTETVQEVTSEPTVGETTEPTQIPMETTVPVTEATQPPETTVQTKPPVILYDVPIAEELQMHIISEAEGHGIDPAIILAMIWRESSYHADAIGDNGDSLGLMQIQPKWNMELMQELGCLDLLDPYQNVRVGVAILAEKLDWYGGDLAKAVTAYNAGQYSGTVTDYARDVLVKAKELNEKYGHCPDK